jgi:IS30 family transposase
MIKNYKHVTVETTTVIQIGLSMGLLPVQMTLSTSTVTRELRRNGWVRPFKIKDRGRPSFSGGNSAPIAHARAIICITQPRVQSRLQLGKAIWKLVTDYLKLGYSPEQVSGTLMAFYPIDSSLQVSHETIYTAIYAMPRGEPCTEVVLVEQRVY